MKCFGLRGEVMCDYEGVGDEVGWALPHLVADVGTILRMVSGI